MPKFSKGSAGIPALHLTTLNKLIDLTPNPQELYFTNLFPSVQYPSDQIEWEVVYGSAGMTPFVTPGSIAPTIAGDGIGYGSASCAMMAEKSFLDVELLNNLRKVGTDRVYETAAAQVARRSLKLRARCINRREWMIAKMMTDGAITYQDKKGMNISVSFGIPTQNIITITGNNVWGTGSTRNPVRDIFDVKRLLADEYGLAPTVFICNSTTLRLMLFDTNIQDLLKASNFGQGDLFARPAPVLASLLGIGELRVMDTMFEVQEWLTGNVTGGSTTTIPVENASDMEAGGKLRFIDVRTPHKWETATISSVDKLNNTVTIAVAPTNSYVGGRDKVVMRKKYIADNKILMFTPTVNGDNIAEVMEAPHTLDRRWGMTTSTWDVHDPEGTWLRIEDKSFPVLYYPHAVASLTVA